MELCIEKIEPISHSSNPLIQSSIRKLKISGKVKILFFHAKCYCLTA